MVQGSYNQAGKRLWHVLCYKGIVSGDVVRLYSGDGIRSGDVGQSSWHKGCTVYYHTNYKVRDVFLYNALCGEVVYYKTLDEMKGNVLGSSLRWERVGDVGRKPWWRAM